MTKQVKSERWNGYELLCAAQILLEWAYYMAPERQGMVDIVQSVLPAKNALSDAHHIKQAVEKSPTRSISGRNSAFDYLDRKIPRSTLYKRLQQDFGLDTKEKMDAFRRAKSTEEVIQLSPELKTKAITIRKLFEKHRAEIEAFSSEHPELNLDWNMRKSTTDIIAR